MEKWEWIFNISGLSMKTENVVRDKSYAFALRVVKLAQYLVKKKLERVPSKQLQGRP